MTALDNYKLEYIQEDAKTRSAKTTASQTYKAERAGRVSSLLRHVFKGRADRETNSSVKGD